MLVSIFTPTHNPEWLTEAFQSLQKQTYKNWEWVVLHNSDHKIPQAIVNDTRVKVFTVPVQKEAGIGAIKKLNCSLCKGELLVELDHDDILTPDCLETLVTTQEETGAGFLYSDFVNFRADGSCNVYDPHFGWTSYGFQYEGKNYTAMRSFPPTPDSLTEIYYAPNHVRAWTREAYDRAGGHNESFKVVDDFELIVRTYLAGVKFAHIPKVLYLYREHNNTYQEKIDIIRNLQQEVQNKYVYDIVQLWCKQNNLPMIDLGGRTGCPSGYTSIDLMEADICHDLVKDGIPFPDSSVGIVRAFDFLEHVPAGQPVINMMNEIYRVLAPGGWLISRTPSTEGRGAFQDPTHLSYWNSNSFWYYTRREQQQYVPAIKCRFQPKRIWNTYPTNWHKEHQILYVYADLIAAKGQTLAGPMYI